MYLFRIDVEWMTIIGNSKQIFKITTHLQRKIRLQVILDRATSWWNLAQRRSIAPENGIQGQVHYLWDVTAYLYPWFLLLVHWIFRHLWQNHRPQCDNAFKMQWVHPIKDLFHSWWLKWDRWYSTMYATFWHLLCILDNSAAETIHTSRETGHF